jgi:hypothetical protein
MRARSIQVGTSGVVPRSSATVLLLGLALAAALAGCNDNGSAGTSTGNPNDGSPSTPSLPGMGGRDVATDSPMPTEGSDHGASLGGFCEADKEVLASADAMTELGFSAADVLAFAAGSHEEAITWHDSELATLGPEKGAHRVTITLTHGDGEVRFMRPKPSNSQGGRDIGGIEPAIAPAPTPGVAVDLPAGVSVGCQPWIEVDVHVTVESDGGALDESFDATLRTRNQLLGAVYAQPDPAKLGGSFAPEQILIAGFKLVQLGLEVAFTPFGVSGKFDGIFEQRSDDSVSAAAGGGAPFAQIGRAGCAGYYGAFPVDLDDMVQASSGADVLDLVGSAGDLAVRWSDGSSTTATLAFTPESGACVLLDNQFAGDVTLIVGGEIALHSADGKLDTHWPGDVRASLESGAVKQASLNLQWKGPQMPGEDSGLPTLDLDSYDGSYVQLMLTVSSEQAGGDASSAMGELSVTGFKAAPCAGGDTPMVSPPPPPDQPADSGGSGPGSVPPSSGGTSGCRGSDSHDLLSGAFTLAE